MQGEHQISLLQTRSDPFPGMRGLETFNFYGDRVRFDWQSTPENHITKAPFHLSTQVPHEQVLCYSQESPATTMQPEHGKERKGRGRRKGEREGEREGKGKEKSSHASLRQTTQATT